MQHLKPNHTSTMQQTRRNKLNHQSPHQIQDQGPIKVPRHNIRRPYPSHTNMFPKRQTMLKLLRSHAIQSSQNRSHRTKGQRSQRLNKLILSINRYTKLNAPQQTSTRQQTVKEPKNPTPQLTQTYPSANSTQQQKDELQHPRLTTHRPDQQQIRKRYERSTKRDLSKESLKPSHNSNTFS